MYKVSGGSRVDGDSGREVDKERRTRTGMALHPCMGLQVMCLKLFFSTILCCLKVSTDQNEYSNMCNMELSVLSKVCSAI